MQLRLVSVADAVRSASRESKEAEFRDSGADPHAVPTTQEIGWWYVPPGLKTNPVQGERLPRKEPKKGSLDQRIEDFRLWLCMRPEQRIVVVGHSAFFQRFLGDLFKLKNCEIREVAVERSHHPRQSAHLM